MAFVRQENYRSLQPCEDCPAFEGMDEIEVTRTANSGPPFDEFYEPDKYPDRVFYAYDPSKEAVKPVVLGKDSGCADAFCQHHEAASSRVLGETHQRIESCQGPQEVRVGIIRKRTKLQCGAGFEKDKHRVNDLQAIAKKQGRIAIGGDIVLEGHSRG